MTPMILVQKIGYGFGGYPPPPLYGYFFAQKCLKIVFFAQKHLFFGKKKLRIWGVPPFTDFFPGKKGVTDLGGIPLPPFTDFSPKICLQKGLKMVLFAQKTPDFGPQNKLRIWGVPPSPPLRIFFSTKRGLRI